MLRARRIQTARSHAASRPDPRRVRALAARGLYTEPTSAVAAAAPNEFIANNTITPDQTTLVVLTGSGLRSADKIANLFPA